MSFWRGQQTFEELNPDWRSHEDTSRVNIKFPNFKAYMKAHRGPSWTVNRRIRRFLAEFEPWAEFKRNSKSEIIQANELFNRFFLGKNYNPSEKPAAPQELQYNPDDNIVLVRHLFVELSDKGIFTIDSEAVLLHERTECLEGIKFFDGIERAWKAIHEEQVYNTRLKEDITYYDMVHSKASEVEYDFYQYMGEKIANVKIPLKAFLYAHPFNEAFGWPGIERLDKTVKHMKASPRLVGEFAKPVTREEIKLAADIFEIGGYHYIDKHRIINLELAP